MAERAAMRGASTRAVQLALHIVPGCAVALAAVMALLTRTSSPIGARVYGGPPGSDGVLAWRVVVLERDHGYFAPVVGAHLRMLGRADGREASCDGTTDENGAWEARLPLPSPDASDVQIDVRADGVAHPVVAGTLPVHPAQWESQFATLAARVSGEGSGDLEISLSLMRGALAAGFPEEVLVHVAAPASKEPVPQARVVVSGEGFTAEPDRELVTDARGDVRLRLLPTHHSPRVEIKATTGVGSEGTWEGMPAVTPGNMWVDPAALAHGRLVVKSPVPHHVAYLTFFNEHARLLATQLALAPDPHGGAMGEIPMPALGDEPLWVLASPDPQGQGMEANEVAWPVSKAAPQGESASALPAATMRTTLLADGVPAAVRSARASERAARARIIAMLALAAVIESVLLLVRARQARDELRAILASQADVDEALLHSIAGGERFWIRLVIAAVLIAAVFGAVALLLWMQV